VVGFFCGGLCGGYLVRLGLGIGFQILLKGVEMPTLLKFILVSVLGIVSAAVLTFILKKNKYLASIL